MPLCRDCGQRSSQQVGRIDAARLLEISRAVSLPLNELGALPEPYAEMSVVDKFGMPKSDKNVWPCKLSTVNPVWNKLKEFRDVSVQDGDCLLVEIHDNKAYSNSVMGWAAIPLVQVGICRYLYIHVCMFRWLQ